MRNYKAWVAKIGTLIVAILVVVGLCEVAVRAFIPVRNVGPSFTAYSPVYGKRLRPSISVVRITPEFTMRFTTNAAGFRQEDEVAPGSRPVLFLGDSFTMGYGVDDGEDFVSLIRTRQPKDAGPYLNAGMGDNGNGRWLKFLQYEAPKYSPRSVVLQLTANDFRDNETESLYALEDGELVALPIPEPGVKRSLQRILAVVPALSNAYLIGLMRQLRLPQATGDVPLQVDDNPESSQELTYQIVDRALAVCEEQGWPVLGLSVQLEGSRLERMQRIFAAHGARLLEMPDKRGYPELYYEVDGHWNQAGHEHVAAMVLKALQD